MAINPDPSKYRSPEKNSWRGDLEKLETVSLNPEPPAFLFNVSCSLLVVIFLKPPSLLPSLFSHAVTHIQFGYWFKAHREVIEAACQSHKLSPKWWQIGCLALNFPPPPIKSRPGFHVRTGSVGGDRWLAHETTGRLAQAHEVSALSLSFTVKVGFISMSRSYKTERELSTCFWSGWTLTIQLGCFSNGLSPSKTNAKQRSLPVFLKHWFSMSATDGIVQFCSWENIWKSVFSWSLLRRT